MTRLAGAVAAMALCAVVARDAPPAGRWLFGALAVLTIAGIWLLVRQWTWGEWAVWVVPLAFSAVVSLLASAGSVLHALYADQLSLSPEELSVPGVWQVIAAGRLLSYLSVGLLLPAGWGIARHYHLVRPGRGNALVYVAVLLMVLVSVSGLAVESAGRAAAAVKEAAREGRQPPSYFGVTPEWACVEPTVPVERLPGEGGRVDPSRPYLSFGVAGDVAVLWDAGVSGPLRVPAGQVRLVPARSGGVECDG